MYQDNRNAKNVRDDKALLKDLWTLVDQADVLIHQNGKKFDRRKINARLIYHDFKPPSSYKQVDTFLLGKRHFGFTSHSLEYMAKFLNVKYKKLQHKKFPGMDLWDEVLKGNIDAWNEMERYNRNDVLALEGIFDKMIAWDNSINVNLYYNTITDFCICGNNTFKKNGWDYKANSKFQRWACKKCGSESRDKSNLFNKEKKASLRVNTVK